MAEDQEFVPPPLEERPLVTFALFAYNQEKYIREAVEGAFAQTYEPLEIILSDDCSTDDTFKIMLKLAADYSGPHQIICRQNCENIGTYNHVITVAREANGQFLIVNAGDDVSYPNRAEILVHNWLVTRLQRSALAITRSTKKARYNVPISSFLPPRPPNSSLAGPK